MRCIHCDEQITNKYNVGWEDVDGTFICLKFDRHEPNLYGHKSNINLFSRIKFIFAWSDMWIGFYWDTKKYILYIFPIPFLGLKIFFKDLRCKKIE